MCSSAALEYVVCICFPKNVSLGKNQLKIFKTMRNEEAIVRP